MGSIGATSGTTYIFGPLFSASFISLGLMNSSFSASKTTVFLTNSLIVISSGTVLSEKILRSS
jgi:hypothetical protein